MPPRHAFWTILIDNQPTAFRAHDPEELLPTLNRLREKNDTAVMKWFERGQLFDSRDDAKEAGLGQGERRWEGPRPERRERETPDAEARRRDKTWRPGGEHRDPRQKYQDAKKAKWTRFKSKIRERHEQRADRDSQSFTPPHGDKLRDRSREQRPYSGDRDRDAASRGPTDRPKFGGTDRPGGTDRADRPKGGWTDRGDRRPSGRGARPEGPSSGWSDRESRPTGGWNNRDDRRDSWRTRDDRRDGAPPRRENRPDWQNRENRENRENRDSRDNRNTRDTRGGGRSARDDRFDRGDRKPPGGPRERDAQGYRESRPSRPHGDKFRDQRPKPQPRDREGGEARRSFKKPSGAGSSGGRKPWGSKPSGPSRPPGGGFRGAKRPGPPRRRRDDDE